LISSEIREALVDLIREANKDNDYRRSVVANPYSGHDALMEYFKSMGVQQGIGMCLDRIDAMEQQMRQDIQEALSD
jgi:hypothetical protein